MLAYAIIGLCIGALSSVPPGLCNLSVINAACRHGLRRSVATGLGAATGDLSYASLAVVGVGPLFSHHPGMVRWLQAVSGLALLGYGVVNVWRRATRSRGAARPPAPTGGTTFRRGFASGLGLMLANPAALMTWVIVVGTLLPSASPLQAWCLVAGIGTGSFGMYCIVAMLACRGAQAFGDRMQRLSTAVGVAIIGYGAFLLSRAV